MFQHNCSSFLTSSIWTCVCEIVDARAIHVCRPTLVFLSGFCVWFHENSKVSKFISAFSQQKNKIQQELFPSAIFGFQRHCPSKYAPFSPVSRLLHKTGSNAWILKLNQICLHRYWTLFVGLDWKWISSSFFPYKILCAVLFFSPNVSVFMPSQHMHTTYFCHSMKKKYRKLLYR